MHLDDIKIHVKFKLSALWASLMFCYVYGDFFTLFVPGHIDSLAKGNSGAGPVTPIKILLFAVMMSIPALMIFMSLILKPKASRLANITFGIFFTLIMILVVVTSLDQWMLFYTYMGVVEVILTLTIIYQAWTWPRQDQPA